MASSSADGFGRSWSCFVSGYDNDHLPPGLQGRVGPPTGWPVAVRVLGAP